MTDAVTIHYSWAYPTVNADADTWGTTLNNAIIAVDASLFTVDTAVAGKLAKASNLSDLPSAGTARTSLGLGAASVESVTNSGQPLAAMYGTFATNNIPIFINTSGSLEDSGVAYTNLLQKTGNLSGLSSASTSRTNLGLGSIATHNVTISSSAPSGGSDGDIWIQYIP